jgi:hypothetical protein
VGGNVLRCQFCSECMNPYSAHHINNPLFTVFPLTNQQVSESRFGENVKEQFCNSRT